MDRLRLTRRQWVLGGVFLLLGCAQLAVQPARDRPGWVFLPQMWHTPAARPEARHPELPAGVVQQQPPPGTVAREAPRLAVGEPGQPPPADLINPLAGRQDVEASGRDLFNSFCIPCHGMRGEGDGLVVARGFPAPPSLTAEPARALTDAAIFQILTAGRNNMPPYRFQLTRDQRWQVIQYVRELQQGPNSGAGSASPGGNPAGTGEATGTEEAAGTGGLR